MNGKGAGFAGSNPLSTSLQTVVYVASEDDLSCHSLSFLWAVGFSLSPEK